MDRGQVLPAELRMLQCFQCLSYGLELPLK